MGKVPSTYYADGLRRAQAKRAKKAEAARVAAAPPVEVDQPTSNVPPDARTFTLGGPDDSPRGMTRLRDSYAVQWLREHGFI